MSPLTTGTLAHRPSVLSPDLFSHEAVAPANGKVATPTGIIIGSAYVAPPPAPSRYEEALQGRVLQWGLPSLTSMERISRPSQAWWYRVYVSIVRWL